MPMAAAPPGKVSTPDGNGNAPVPLGMAPVPVPVPMIELELPGAEYGGKGAYGVATGALVSVVESAPMVTVLAALMVLVMWTVESS